jgi:hypothetical protein
LQNKKGIYFWSKSYFFALFSGGLV